MKKVPYIPTKEMLKAGYNTLSELYPPKENGGSAIGQYIVWQSMYDAYDSSKKKKNINNIMTGIFLLLNFATCFIGLYFDNNGIYLSIAFLFSFLSLYFYSKDEVN